MASPLSAAGAYASIARLATDPTRTLANAAGAGAAKDDTGFAAMLKNAIGAVTEVGRKSDAQAQAMVNGKSDMAEERFVEDPIDLFTVVNGTLTFDCELLRDEKKAAHVRNLTFKGTAAGDQLDLTWNGRAVNNTPAHGEAHLTLVK